MRMGFRRLAWVVVLLQPLAAHAIAISPTLYLQGVTFADGATATGSITYNAAAVLDPITWNITTSGGGTGFPASTQYFQDGSVSQSIASVVYADTNSAGCAASLSCTGAYSADFTETTGAGVSNLVLNVASQPDGLPVGTLTDFVLTACSSGNGCSEESFLATVDPTRQVTAGSLSLTPPTVPLPASAWMLISALASLGLFIKRRRADFMAGEFSA